VLGSNGGAGAGGDTSSSGSAPAGTGGTNGSHVLRPRQLPNTGGTGSAAPVAITIAALLIACGMCFRNYATKNH
jgi:LPXTG-motif cell wall-anchored protein